MIKKKKAIYHLTIYQTSPDGKHLQEAKYWKQCDLHILICSFEGKKTVGKEENAGYQHFLLLPHCFRKAPLAGSSKLKIVC